MGKRNSDDIREALAAMLSGAGVGTRIDMGKVAFTLSESMEAQFKVLAMMCPPQETEMFYKLVGQIIATVISKFVPVDKEKDTLATLTEARKASREAILAAMNEVIPRINKSDIVMRDIGKHLTPEMKRKIIDDNVDDDNPSPDLQQLIDQINKSMDSGDTPIAT